MQQNQRLKQRVEILERENRDLRRSVYDLNVRMKKNGDGTSSLETFDIDRALSTEVDSPERSEHAYSQFLDDVDEPEGIFALRKELSGHTAAVYAIKYSPCGRILASGSLDKTVRLWDPSLHKEVKVLEGHTLNVIDVAWGHDSNLLASGSYDKTVKLWLADVGQMKSSHTLDGMVQSVAVSQEDASDNSSSVFASTSKKSVYQIDARDQNSGEIIFSNDSIVNTIQLDGNLLLTGDGQGMIKTWDIRARKCVASFANDECGRPISHLALPPREAYDDQTSYLAVNSYDNVLRVYDRGEATAHVPLHLLHTVTGHTTKNWPIQCSFFRDSSSVGRAKIERPKTTTRSGSTADSHGDYSRESIFLAIGSADSVVRVFDVSEPEGPVSMLQALDGHSDRVYSVDFHPKMPALASGSADATVRVWTAKSRRLQHR